MAVQWEVLILKHEFENWNKNPFEAIHEFWKSILRVYNAPNKACWAEKKPKPCSVLIWIEKKETMETSKNKWPYLPVPGPYKP